MTTSTAAPIIDDPKQLLLDMARERSLPELLQLIVHRLTAPGRSALVRIWLLQPGDICERCPMRVECPDQTRCLHLVASAGRSEVDSQANWSRVDGNFRRFPLGIRKVGRIASSGEPLVVSERAAEGSWIVRPDWAMAEGIVGFAGQPLVHHGQVLGVLGVFTRAPLGEGCLDWLRMIADHAAASIANARVFAEIEQLRRQLEQENEYLREEVRHSGAFGDLIGDSSALQAVVRQIDMVAPTDSSVLVLGESGTGKELVARAIHQRSLRVDRPLIKVNCAAVPRELYESEFFGHARGSFTGALRDRAGRFELADGGTLFLDEVGEIPLELQAKLLRVLQEGELERVGEERTRRVNVRLVAASNRDLRSEAESGKFRQDLYYRLSVFPIELPPLRRRKEDIPALAEHFLLQVARKMGRRRPRLTLANLQALQQYDWPGNVRELQHVIERGVITSVNDRMIINISKLEPLALSKPPEIRARVLTDTELRQLEADNIRNALRQAEGKVYGMGGAAALLGIKPTTLASRMKTLGIRASQVDTDQPKH